MPEKVVCVNSKCGKEFSCESETVNGATKNVENKEKGRFYHLVRIFAFLACLAIPLTIFLANRVQSGENGGEMLLHKFPKILQVVGK